MASKGYVISVATDSRLFEQGVRMGIIKPVEDADDALTDLGKNKGPAQLEAELKDAQRATDKLGDEVRQSAKQMQADYRKTGQVARDAADEGGDGWARSTRKSSAEAGASVKEFGNEAKQNISETFSSFRGDVTDFGQVAQDTLGGLASGLEGIPGIAAVAAGAAGIGLILGAITNGQVESEAWKADVADLAQAFIDAGGTGEVSLDRVVEKLKELATTGDDTGTTLTKLQQLSRETGHNFEDIAQAYAGNSKALRKMIADGDDHARSVQKQITSLDQYDDAQRKKLGGLEKEVSSWNTLGDTLERAANKADEAAKAEQAYNESGAPAAQAHADAVDAFASSVQQSLQDAGSAWEDYNNDGKTSLDEYNQHIEDQIAATQAYQENIKTVSKTISQEALNYLLSLGDQAAPILQAYVDAPLDQQQRTAANWASLGATAGVNYTNSLKAGIPSSVVGPDIVARWRVDDSALRAAIRAQTNVTIPVTLVDARTGKRAW